VLAAAFPALNRVGEGSSPSGPTDKHWSSSGQDSAPVMRIRRFESGRVLWFIDNLVVTQSAHDVTAACCLARAEERVQFPLGAHFQDVGKSGIPRASGARDRWFKSSRPD
jgi:hypothetical protein